MQRITSVDRLIEATSGLGIGNYTVERQVNRIKDRLRSGNDEEGTAFTPLKGNRRQDPPLSNAAKLFDGVRYDMVKSSTGFSQSAELKGQAATILAYQDKLRPFAGWGTEDRSEATEDLASEIFQAMRGGH